MFKFCILPGLYTGFFNWGGSGLSLGGMVRQFQWVQGGMVRQFQCPGGAPAPPPPSVYGPAYCIISQKSFNRKLRNSEMPTKLYYRK